STRDWSSDVCSSDLLEIEREIVLTHGVLTHGHVLQRHIDRDLRVRGPEILRPEMQTRLRVVVEPAPGSLDLALLAVLVGDLDREPALDIVKALLGHRSTEGADERLPAADVQ